MDFYTIVYQKETDGEILLSVGKMNFIMDLIRNENLTDHDFAVIKGFPLKTFNEKYIRTGEI